MAYGMDVSHYSMKFKEFYSAILSKNVDRLLSEYPREKSLDIDYAELEKYDRELAELLLKQPDAMIGAAEEALFGAYEVAFRTAHPDMAFEPHVRFFNLTSSEKLIQDISVSNDKDRLISIKGKVTKCGPVRHKVKIAVYKCNMCEAKMKVPMNKGIEAPSVCSECKRRALKLEDEDSYFVEERTATVQELRENFKGNAPLPKIEILMEDDLVKKVITDETVQITGVLRMRPKNKGAKQVKDKFYIPYIDVVSIS